MFNHIPELLGLLVLGLIIFGPKRMIEMGGQAGRMLRELRSAMKEMNWSVLGDESGSSNTSSQTTLGKLSQFAQELTAQRQEPAESAPVTAAPNVVEAAAQPTSDTPAD